MDNLLELVGEAPLPAILLVVSLALLPCISKIVDSLCGLFFNLVLLVLSIIKWKDIQKGNIIIKSDFRGAKLEIRKNTFNDEEDAKEETPSIGEGKKVIDLKNFLGGQS